MRVWPRFAQRAGEDTPQSAGFSTLLFVATVVMWVRNVGHDERWEFLHFTPNGTARAWRFAGVGFWHGRDAVDPQTGRPQIEAFALALPFWMLAIVFGIWPALFVTRRLLRKKRFAAGLCPQCGYDLRATPERCPECGRVVEKGE